MLICRLPAAGWDPQPIPRHSHRLVSQAAGTWSYGLSALLVFGATCSVLFLTERFGRRTLVLTGGSLCCGCNFLIAGLGTIKSTKAINNVILAFICIWVCAYAFCLAGVSWGLSAEVSSPRLRAKTTAFSQNFYQAFGIIFGFTIPLMLGTGPGAAGW